VATIRDVVVDCARPSRLAGFWAEVLDGYAVAPYDDAELARLLALGATVLDDRRLTTDQLVVLTDSEGNDFCLLS
jgi:hypothetical protein